MTGAVSVAVLAPSWSLPAWEVRALERLVEATDATVDLVVIDEREGGRSPAETLRRAAELREWAAVAGLLQVANAVRGPLPETRDRPLSDVPGVADAAHESCTPETVDGWKHALPAPTVERLAEADVAVRFGFGFLTGDALDAPPLGVLSYHHGDVREYRGQPMGFWEYVEGESEAGVTLQRLTETLDGGEVVAFRPVDIEDAATWREVKRRLFAASEDMLAEGVRALASGRRPEQSDDLGELYSHPRGRPVLTYLRKTAAGLLPA